MSVLRGSHSHEKALLFQKTVFPTAIVPVEKEAVRRLTTKKCGSPLRRSPCLGLSFAGTGFRSFLFEVLEKVIQCFIQSGFQALFHDAHNLFFKNGLLALFLLFSVAVFAFGIAYPHLTFTSLVIFTFHTSFCSASACFWASLASYSLYIFLRNAVMIWSGV